VAALLTRREVAQDDAAAQLLQAHGFAVLRTSARHRPEAEGARLQHVSTRALLYCALSQLSELGYDAILQDAPLVWRREPRDEFFYQPQWLKARPLTFSPTLGEALTSGLRDPLSPVLFRIVRS
jgi:hypothetical protein